MATLVRILIVGGGIAGLTLATALHRQGFTAELVERSPTWQASCCMATACAEGLESPSRPALLPLPLWKSPRICSAPQKGLS